MLSNGQTWKEGVDIMEVAEDLEDVRGRWNHNTRPLRRPEQKAEQKAREEAEMMERTREMHGLSPVQSSAERFQQRFTSSLLKKALIDIEPAPSLLPPRDDLKGHMDEQMHDQMTKEVMKGVREPLNPKKKNRRPQIDPRINPDGVVASVDGKSEIRIRLRGKEEIIPVAPQDIMKAVRQAENLSMANPGFPVVFILDEEGVITEDTYINGNHVGDTVEKFGAMEEDKDFAMSGKTGPFYRIDTMDWNDLAAYHGKRFADAVQAGKKVTVYRAGKPGETLVPNTFLSANKNMARSYQHESTESFGGPVMYRYEVDPKDLLHVENFEASELVYKPRTKTSAEYTQQDADDDATTEIWLDQVSDSEDEAKRFFMQENYLQQIAQDDGINMEQLWDKMGEEYIAEFYGYPYKRVPDFTDEATKGLEEKEEPQELRLSGS